MNNIVKIDDMQGLLSYPNDVLSDSFDNVAYEVEMLILRQSLGDAEYINLIADLVDGEPQSAKYIQLIDGLNYVNNSSVTVIYQGLRSILKYFVWSELIKTNLDQSTLTGTVNTEHENAVNVARKQINHNGNIKFNLGVDLINTELYNYLLFNQSDYPNWLFHKTDKWITNGLIS